MTVKCEMWCIAIGSVDSGTLEKVCRQERSLQCCYCHWMHLLGLAVTGIAARTAADSFQCLSSQRVYCCRSETEGRTFAAAYSVAPFDASAAK